MPRLPARSLLAASPRSTRRKSHCTAGKSGHWRRQPQLPGQTILSGAVEAADGVAVGNHSNLPAWRQAEFRLGRRRLRARLWRRRAIDKGWRARRQCVRHRHVKSRGTEAVRGSRLRLIAGLVTTAALMTRPKGLRLGFNPGRRRVDFDLDARIGGLTLKNSLLSLSLLF